MLGDEVCGGIFCWYAGEDSSPVHVGTGEPLVEYLFPWCLAGVPVVEEPHDAYRGSVVFPVEEPRPPPTSFFVDLPGWHTACFIIQGLLWLAEPILLGPKSMSLFQISLSASEVSASLNHSRGG